MSIVPSIYEAFNNLDSEKVSKILDLYKRYKAGEVLDLLNTVKEFDEIEGFKNLVSEEEVLTFLKQAAKMKELEEDKKEIDSDTKTFNEKVSELKEIYKDKEDKYRKMMEVDLPEKANQETDEEKKKEMLDTSQAYKNGYTLEPLIEFINSDEFKKLEKKYTGKRFRRLEDDYNYISQKVVSTCPRLTGIKSALKYMTNNSIYKHITEEQIDRMVIAIGLYARLKCNYNYKPDTWFLYNVGTNIIKLAMTISPITEFDKERSKYLLDFFTKI